MTRPVFIAPLGYPLGGLPRFCRLLTIGSSRHVTACLASIPADEPVLVTAQRPANGEMCSACREDLRVREARGDDLTPYAGEIGVRAEPTVRLQSDRDRAEELEDAIATALDAMTVGIDLAEIYERLDAVLGDRPKLSDPEPTVQAAEELFGPVVARTVTPLQRPAVKVDPAEAWDEWWREVRDDGQNQDYDDDDHLDEAS